MFELRKNFLLSVLENYWNWLSNQKDNIVMSLIDKFVKYGIWNRLSTLKYLYYLQWVSLAYNFVYLWWWQCDEIYFDQCRFTINVLIYMQFHRLVFLEKCFTSLKHRNDICFLSKITSATEYLYENAF